MVIFAEDYKYGRRKIGGGKIMALKQFSYKFVLQICWTFNIFETVVCFLKGRGEKQIEFLFYLIYLLWWPIKLDYKYIDRHFWKQYYTS